MEYINVKFVAPLLTLSSLVASDRCDLDAWLKWESEFRPAIGDDGISIVNKLVQKAQDKYPNRFVFSIKEIGWKPSDQARCYYTYRHNLSEDRCHCVELELEEAVSLRL